MCSIFLIEVDDLAIAVHPKESQALKDELTKRFQFGKWKTGESDYAGKHIRQRPGFVLVDQEKYILENGG